jgi:hypothetical protein
MRIISGHQPCYLPWLGLIHKASLSDVFVFMDDVQYLRNDWNNRNRIKTPQGSTLWLTVPIDLKNSSSECLKDILIAREEHLPERKKWQSVHWATLQMAYGNTPYFSEYKPFFHWLYRERTWERLTDLNLALLKQIFLWFDINTELVIASHHSFQGKKSDLVLDHGLRFNADVVVTGRLGKEYIKEDSFREKGIDIVYQDYRHPVYNQKFGDFVSQLSCVDLLFSYGPESRDVCLQNNVTKEDICRGLSV